MRPWLVGAAWIGTLVATAPVEVATLLIAGGAPTLAAVTTYVLSRRKLDSVHDLVNSQRTEMLKEITSLRAELADAKIVPTTPSANR